jgi:hypothetical protein
MAVWGCLAWGGIRDLHSQWRLSLPRATLRIWIPIGPVQILTNLTIFQCCNTLNNWHISSSISLHHQTETFVTLKIEAVFFRKEENLIITRCAIKKKNKIWLMLDTYESSQYSDWLRAGQPGDRIPVGGAIFSTLPDWLWGPPSLLYNGYRVTILWLKRPGCGFDHPSISSTQVKERVELYLYSLSRPLWFVLGWTYLISCRFFRMCF